MGRGVLLSKPATPVNGLGAKKARAAFDGRATEIAGRDATVLGGGVFSA
jgi:hypothetical protein